VASWNPKVELPGPRVWWGQDSTYMDIQNTDDLDPALCKEAYQMIMTWDSKANGRPPNAHMLDPRPDKLTMRRASKKDV
jgi:hypothetical protein